MLDGRAARLMMHLLVALFVTTGLSACTSLSGTQVRIVDPRLANGGLDGLPVRKALENFDAHDDTVRGNRTRREYRDYVVSVYQAAIEANYGEFSSGMSSERRELGLGIDLVTVAFTNYAAVARRSIVNDLSAAASGFAGARGALDRNVYYDRAVPVFIGSMDAERAWIQVRIAEGLRRDPDQYSLHDAFRDLILLESAGSIDRALIAVSGQVDQQRQRADRELASAIRACTAEGDAVEPARRLSDYIRGLATPDAQGVVSPANLVELRLVATTMDVPPEGTPDLLLDVMLERLAIGSQGRCGRADIEALIARIEQVTGKDI